MALSKSKTYRARRLAAQAALLGYRHRGAIHYTQGSRRWDGINRHRDASKGQYPTYADCSAFTTWALWNGLYLAHKQPDVVNRCQWNYGYTGTQIKHGHKVTGVKNMRMGDLVFYAKSGSTPTHVAIMVGRKPEKTGTPYVVSHGSEAGPLFLPWNYRRVVQVRRHI